MGWRRLAWLEHVWTLLAWRLKVYLFLPDTVNYFCFWPSANNYFVIARFATHVPACGAFCETFVCPKMHVRPHTGDESRMGFEAV